MGRLFAPKAKPVEPEAPVVAAPPATLTKDEVKELVTGAVAGVAAQLSDTVNRLGSKVEELAARQPQVVVQPAQTAAPVARQTVSDEEIDAAVLSGQGAAQRIRAMVDAAVNRATQRVIEEHVRPLQDFGVSTLGELSRRVTAGSMPSYGKYKKEVDERLGALDPAVRANPAVIEMVYNAVVGAHVADERREAAEAAVRQAQDANTQTQTPQGRGTASPGTGATGGTRDTSSDLPDARAVAGEEGIAALAHKGSGGQDQDAFARGMGYKDWADYQKQYNDLLKAESQGNA